MIRAAQPLGACPGGRAPRQNWGKFEAHKWGGFTGRLDDGTVGRKRCSRCRICSARYGINLARGASVRPPSALPLLRLLMYSSH